jgi:hypothetical protein
MTNTATKTRHWTDYQVGQQVYFQSYSKGGSMPLVVKFVGRKYVRFEERRDDFVAEKGHDIIREQGYGAIGRLYESEQAYKDRLAHIDLSKKISAAITDRADTLPPEKIKEIAEILGIES